MAKKNDSDDLTPTEAKFAAAQIKGLSKAKAAVAAGLSKKSARSAGSRMSTKRNIQKAIKQGSKQLIAKAIVTEEEILRGLANMAALDLGQAYDSEGRLLHVKDMPEALRRSLAGVEVDSLFQGPGGDGERLEVGTTTKIKIADRVRAYELLGRKLKLWTDKVEHSGKLTLEQLVEESMRGGEE